MVASDETQVYRIHTCVHIYRPQRSCGQSYVFTRVCDSVHRGGGSPGRENPPGQGESPWAGRPPRQQTPTLDQTSPPGQGEPPREQTPPRKHTPAYGQRAAGTHPTGMHSCNYIHLQQLLNNFLRSILSYVCFLIVV